MIKFSKEKVLLLHKLIAQETGGSVGVRDDGLLESALEGVFATFDGQELYPTKEEKGARLGFTLISNHAFVDGNKRIACMSCSLSWKSMEYELKPATKRWRWLAWRLPQGRWAMTDCLIG